MIKVQKIFGIVLTKRRLNMPRLVSNCNVDFSWILKIVTWLLLAVTFLKYFGIEQFERRNCSSAVQKSIAAGIQASCSLFF
jgi:hypothetical protein